MGSALREMIKEQMSPHKTVDAGGQKGAVSSDWNNAIGLDPLFALEEDTAECGEEEREEYGEADENDKKKTKTTDMKMNV